MRIIYTRAEMEQAVSGLRAGGRRIGFVPTMGALHEGHLSLIRESRRRTDVTVCSIFVNPTQFNDKKDLERYPRTPEHDMSLLESVSCDILFMPSVTEIYPAEDTRVFDFGELGNILDGAARPGHFNGVGQVVSILFEIVKPHLAFFGQKDYQQVMIIRDMVRQLHLPVEIVPCPILREPDGLAMSSRNTLLTAEERQVASHIPKIMEQAKVIYAKEGLEAAKNYVNAQVALQPLMKLDYFKICDRDTLRELSAPSEQAISLIAVFVGRIRLIDNLYF